MKKLTNMVLMPPFSRICNSGAVSISIFNAKKILVSLGHRCRGATIRNLQILLGFLRCAGQKFACHR